MVHVSGPHPPGVLLVTADGCGKIIKLSVKSSDLLTDGEVHGDLVHLLLGGRLGQVGVLEVAALHRVKPVHTVSSPGVRGVTSPDNYVC